MKTETYYISKNQYLGQLEPFKTKGLPINSIIHKKLTGCGATTLELEYSRNSIIIEPNVPVIIGKCNKMNQGKRKNKVVQGVDEKVSVADIVAYVKHQKGYKKILTTPEGFEKVAAALGESMYKDYFLLFDECEKTIEDVDYRSNIVNPFDAFFTFDNKAMVSATPLMPTDPRFAQFSQVIVEPNYDYKETIQVCPTNNVVFNLKMILDHYDAMDDSADRKYFIFFKSTKRIRNMINGLQLTNHAVYCSDSSAKDLRRNNINAYDSINENMVKYNFFTSRFFSAVDIDFEKYQCTNPVIIMISDVLAVEHSVIDPVTEAIQICGRLRKPEQKESEPAISIDKNIYHISNYNSKLTSFTSTEVMAILEDKRRMHEFISTYKPTSDVEYINQFIEEILAMNGFNYFIREQDGQLNHFMVDNFINDERVKGYYQTTDSLIKQYQTSTHFKVHADSTYNNFTLTDEQLLSVTDQTAYTTVNDLVSQRVKEIMQSEMDSIGKSMNLSMLRFIFKAQMFVIDQYGIDNAALLEYDINKIEQQLKEAQGLKKLLPIIKYIHRVVKIGDKLTSVEIEALLVKGIKETGLSSLKPDVRLLRNAVNLSERKSIKKDENGNWLKGYEVLGFVQNF